MFESFHDFEVLAKRLDFEVAAKDLAISQPTLSRHILALEQELGVRLFDRRPLRLTQAGVYLLENMIPLINEAEAVAKKAVDFSTEKLEAPLLVSLIDPDGTLTQTIMSAAVKMKALCSNFVLRIETDSTRSLTDMVFSKASELAFLATKPARIKEGFQCTFVMNDTMSLWVHKDNPILNNKQPRLADLAHNALVVTKNRALNSWSEALIELFQKAQIPMQTHQKNLDVLIEHVLDIQPNEVIAFPSHMEGIQPDAANPCLRKVPLDPKELTYSIWALYPKNAANPLIEPFLTICKQISKSTTIEK